MIVQSTISNSDVRRYFGALAAATLIVIGLATAMVLLTLRLGREVNLDWALLDHQLRKIGGAPVPDTIFVGDSSLGNAISAEEWSKLAGRPAVSLALTGS